MKRLEYFFRFHGRANRSEYWVWAILASFGFIFCFLAMVGAIITDDTQATPLSAATLFAPGMLIIYFLPLSSLSFAVRRLHDFGYSGSLLLYFWASLYGLLLFGSIIFDMNEELGNLIFGVILMLYTVGSLIISLMLMFRPGTQGENIYGAPQEGIAPR